MIEHIRVQSTLTFYAMDQLGDADKSSLSLFFFYDLLFLSSSPTFLFNVTSAIRFLFFCTFFISLFSFPFFIYRYCFLSCQVSASYFRFGCCCASFPSPLFQRLNPSFFFFLFIFSQCCCFCPSFRGFCSSNKNHHQIFISRPLLKCGQTLDCTHSDLSCFAFSLFIRPCFLIDDFPFLVRYEYVRPVNELCKSLMA